MKPQFDNTIHLIEEWGCVLKGQGTLADGKPFDLVYDPMKKSLFVVADENSGNTEVYFEAE
jgi:hypothetical protein